MGNINEFQIRVLEWLNPSYGRFESIDYIKSIWLKEHLKHTIEDVRQWISDLVNAEYIQEEVRQTDIFLLMINRNIEPTFSLFCITQKGRNLLALLNEKMTKNPPLQKIILTDEPRIIDCIGCLNGKWQGNKIMKDADFERLKEYTLYVIQNNALPKRIQKIPPTNISTAFIRRTFYELYKTFKPKVGRKVWIEFLHKAFQQCQETIETTTKKFSRYPDNSNYETDKSIIE